MEKTLSLILDKLDSVDKKVNSLDHRLTGLDQKVEAMDHRLTGLDQKVEAIDNRLTALDQKVEVMDHRLTGLDQKVEAIDNRLTALDQKVEAMDNRLTAEQKRQGDLLHQLINTVAATNIKISETNGKMAAIETKTDDIARQMKEIKDSMATKQDLEYYDQMISEHSRQIYKLKNH